MLASRNLKMKNPILVAIFVVAFSEGNFAKKTTLVRVTRSASSAFSEKIAVQIAGHDEKGNPVFVTKTRSIDVDADGRVQPIYRKETRTLGATSGQPIIPLGGNAYITKPGSSRPAEVITDNGLKNWKDSGSICSVYFKLASPEVFQLSLRLRVPSGTSKIRVSIPNINSFDTLISGSEPYIQSIGTFSINSPGYVKLDLQGLSKSGDNFAEVFDVVLSNIKGNVEFVSDPSNFYFGRRGPSVHLSYSPVTDQGDAIKYFYNEVTVPVGEDKIGTYFMVNGFGDGYFGIQRNSETERRILFSVFSDYVTDDPTMVPTEYRVIALKNGTGVTVQDFGHEGSGLQTFRQFPWQSGQTYKFLVYGAPVDAGNTKYTAWVKSPSSDWQLIASIQKPKVSTYLTGLYSFLENFIPAQGYLTRKVIFGNQWAMSTKGVWKQVLKTQFTGDATSENGRLDFAGGLSDDPTKFYLKNCGFFNEFVKTNTYYTRNPTSNGGVPDVNIASLP